MQQAVFHLFQSSFFKSSTIKKFITSSSLMLLAISSVSAQKEDPIPSAEKEPLTEVIFLPTIHRNHLKSKSYSIDHLKVIVQEIKPDFVCTEIVPTSLKTFDLGKKDRRLSLFPEYTEAILPLRNELKYEVIPCSAYSKEINFKTVGVKKMTESHSKKIAKALDKFKGQGKKVLVTFGSGHISGLIKHLSSRKDIKVIDYRPTLQKLNRKNATAK